MANESDWGYLQCSTDQPRFGDQGWSSGLYWSYIDVSCSALLIRYVQSVGLQVVGWSGENMGLTSSYCGEEWSKVWYRTGYVTVQLGNKLAVQCNRVLCCYCYMVVCYSVLLCYTVVCLWECCRVFEHTVQQSMLMTACCHLIHIPVQLTNNSTLLLY